MLARDGGGAPGAATSAGSEGAWPGAATWAGAEAGTAAPEAATAATEPPLPAFCGVAGSVLLLLQSGLMLQQRNSI